MKLKDEQIEFLVPFIFVGMVPVFVIIFPAFCWIVEPVFNVFDKAAMSSMDYFMSDKEKK